MASPKTRAGGITVLKRDPATGRLSVQLEGALAALLSPALGDKRRKD
ncbi:MAG: hypothetical protein KBT70_05850 [Roseovarius sp.]|nr:hypothetical protein [Roseovarius sp.]